MESNKETLFNAPRRITPEFASVLKFARRFPNIESWDQCINIASPDIKRLNLSDVQQLQDCLQLEEGTPAIITDALKTWPARDKWSFHSLLLTCGAQHIVHINDRAPARHADRLPGNGGAQTTMLVRLDEFIRYILEQPVSVDQYNNNLSSSSDDTLSDRINTNKVSTPFYLNGWRAFIEFPQLLRDCKPLLVDSLDHTRDILQEIDAKLFGKSAPPAIKQNEDSSWCQNVDANLTKLFIGPPGTVTRLHYDAGEAHGWLGQIQGRKLFVLFPPSQTEFLQPLESEKETVQSAFDPLHLNDYFQADNNNNIDSGSDTANTQKRALACILQEGEALLIPKGWWHYAVSLERSITVQRNFYHAHSNAHGLVHIVKNLIAMKLKNGSVKKY